MKAIYLSADNLTFQYPRQFQPLLSGLGFQLDSQSRIGLIGKNGVGKSTLLRLLWGELQPSAGRLLRQPELRLGYLPQAPGATLLQQAPEATVADFLWQALPELAVLRQVLLTASEQVTLAQLERFEALGGYRLELEAEKALTALGGQPEWLERPLASLSGGERARVGLCFLELQQANFLLLDEPGNDLDSEMLEWLTDYLHSSALPYLLISHDRRLLDDCCDQIWELKAGQLRMRQGNYATYRQQREQEQAHQAMLYSQQRRKQQQLKSVVQERKQVADSHERFKARRSVRNNGGICKRDDGSGRVLRKGNLMRSAMAAQHRLEKLAQATEQLRPERQFSAQLKFAERALAPRRLLSVERLSYFLPPAASAVGQPSMAAQAPLFGRLHFGLQAGQRLALTGPNGAGKSTLLRLLMAADMDSKDTAAPVDPLTGQSLGQQTGQIHWSRGVKWGYYAQQLPNLPADLTALDWVSQGLPESDERERLTLGFTLLACLGLDTGCVRQPLAQLSRGEQGKVVLAGLLAQPLDLLLLDEPTNHLELAAREGLEQALQQFQGAVLLVCHDREFREAVADRELEVGVYPS